ncbi:MFS transporter [Brevundimonas sp.]|uniref:MFS transporter n=1 Tax=Brevundimonas sp. TaxID=1871086 RepID=UPI0027379F90|nr:MFS transporter [Brevundimonas sp.]MDP3800772.1 MFS transporter [Brevundimonas sp.]
MTAAAGSGEPRRPPAWLLLYALAWGGGVVAYTPLLTLLLPLRIAALGLEDKVGGLSLAVLAGAVTASIANIAAGALSDRFSRGPGGRRPWVVAGLAATAMAYALVGMADTLLGILAAVAMFQAGLNLMLAPLAALAADEAPDAQKGLLGGLMGAAYPLGALSGVVVMSASSPEARLAVTVAIAAILITPFLLIFRDRAAATPPAAHTTAVRAGRARDLAAIWGARLLVQIAGAILFAYLLYYFETVEVAGERLDADRMAVRVAWLSGVVAAVTVPLSILLGRWSDLVRARKPFLQGAALASAVGLVLMALFPDWGVAAWGYGLFATSSAIFLALQSTYAMQLLPSPEHRGRDLGVLNLTNTLPAILGPGLAYATVGAGGFRPLMLLLAGLAVLAAVLMSVVRER